MWIARDGVYQRQEKVLRRKEMEITKEMIENAAKTRLPGIIEQVADEIITEKFSAQIDKEVSKVAMSLLEEVLKSESIKKLIKDQLAADIKSRLEDGDISYFLVEKDQKVYLDTLSKRVLTSLDTGRPL